MRPRALRDGGEQDGTLSLGIESVWEGQGVQINAPTLQGDAWGAGPEEASPR